MASSPAGQPAPANVTLSPAHLCDVMNITWAFGTPPLRIQVFSQAVPNVTAWYPVPAMFMNADTTAGPHFVSSNNLWLNPVSVNNSGGFVQMRVQSDQGSGLWAEVTDSAGFRAQNVEVRVVEKGKNWCMAGQAGSASGDISSASFDPTITLLAVFGSCTCIFLTAALFLGWRVHSLRRRLRLLALQPSVHPDSAPRSALCPPQAMDPAGRSQGRFAGYTGIIPSVYPVQFDTCPVGTGTVVCDPAPAYSSPPSSAHTIRGPSAPSPTRPDPFCSPVSPICQSTATQWTRVPTQRSARERTPGAAPARQAHSHQEQEWPAASVASVWGMDDPAAVGPWSSADPPGSQLADLDAGEQRMGRRGDHASALMEEEEDEQEWRRGDDGAALRGRPGSGDGRPMSWAPSEESDEFYRSRRSRAYRTEP